MNLQITGRHLEVTPTIHSYVTGKLDRVTRRFDGIIDANVVLSVDKLKQKAEITVHLSGKDIFVEASAEDMYAAIDALIDKLDRQFQKHKEKLTDRRRGQRNTSWPPE